MREIECQRICGEGLTKKVFGPVIDATNGQLYVYKHFKNIESQPYSIEEQNNILAKKEGYFGRFIPETKLEQKSDGTYCIKQRFIKGKLLKDINIDELSQKTVSDLLELIKSYIQYVKKEGKRLDVHGCQDEDLTNLGRFDKKRNVRINTYSKLYKSFLISSNIIISDNGEVYMVDVCDVCNTNTIYSGEDIMGKIKSSIRNLVINTVINIGITKTKGRLRWILIKQKYLSDLMKNFKTTR